LASRSCRIVDPLSVTPGAHLDVGRCAGVTADRTGRHRRVRADLELVVDELFEPAPVLHDQQEVHRLATDLRADAAAVDGEKCG